MNMKYVNILGSSPDKTDNLLANSEQFTDRKS